MSSQYILHRGGQQLSIEKEANYFTAILPNKKLQEDVQKQEPVLELKQVFGSYYKVRTEQEALDDVMNRMRSNHRLSHIVHHAYRPVGDLATRYYLTDAIVVRFAKRTSNSKMEKICQLHGLKFIREYERNRTFLFQITKTTAKNPVKACFDLNEYEEIEFAEPNLINRFQTAYKPSDTVFANQWHLDAWSGFNLIKDADIKAVKAWDLERGKREVVVGILDDGFDLTHPDLQGENKVVFPRDFVDNDFEPLAVRRDGDYHGTPCAGVAIGEINGEGIVGIAPGCSFMPIRFDLNADDNRMYDIFEYAGSRADVLSCSWGPVPVYSPLSSLLFNQISNLAESGGRRGKGCVIVFSAGNFNAPIVDVQNQSFWWRHHSNGLKQTRGPIRNGYASHPDVICVTASTSLNEKAAYSNWGKEASVCAPSDNWHPLDRQERLPGRGIWTADNDVNGQGYDSGLYTGQFGGTSSAAPLVAGTAALLISANSNLTAKQVKEILETTTDKITDSKPDMVLNHRKGTYNEEGHSEWFGYGKINAFKALQKAISLGEQTPPHTNAENPTPEGIVLIAGMVNPKGEEEENEFLILMNKSDQNIDLTGWYVQDHFRRQDDLSGLIGAGSVLKFKLKNVKLSNSGGMVRLYSFNKELVQQVNYSAEEAEKEGWLVQF